MCIARSLILPPLWPSNDPLDSFGFSRYLFFLISVNRLWLVASAAASNTLAIGIQPKSLFNLLYMVSYLYVYQLFKTPKQLSSIILRRMKPLVVESIDSKQRDHTAVFSTDLIPVPVSTSSLTSRVGTIDSLSLNTSVVLHSIQAPFTHTTLLSRR